MKKAVKERKTVITEIELNTQEESRQDGTASENDDVSYLKRPNLTHKESVISDNNHGNEKGEI